MAQMIRTFNDDNTVCSIAPRKAPEGVQVKVMAIPGSVVVLGHTMSLEAAQLLREALSVAIIISGGMKQ